MKERRLTIKDYQNIIKMLVAEPDITPSEISKIFGVSTSSIYDINRGRIKIVQELWGKEFPIRPLGPNKTAAMMNDLRSGMKAEAVSEKWGVSKEYANILRRRVEKENK